MSSQRGNIARTRPQKHPNRRVFKNDLHDTNIRTKRINQIQITNVCDKCKAIIDWKIKYKKYKLLKSPKFCNKCGDKAVKQSYNTVCQPCAQKLRICPKCNVAFTKPEENVNDVDSCNPAEIFDAVNSFNSDQEPYSEASLSDSDGKFIEKMSKIVLNS